METETAPVQETEELVEEAFEEPEGYKDGTYYGSARGFGGNIQVQIVITEGKIADISIVSASAETPSYLASARSVINRILSAQSPNVDTVSGATYSSNGIINAVKSALRQAAGSNGSEDLSEDETLPPASNGTGSNSGTKPVIKEPVVSRDGYVDGVYEGTAEGFGGDITVQVKVSGGKIAAVKILSAEDETPSYLEQAKAVIDRIIKAQSPAVDVVSGATYSSTGIINAVSAALNKALPEGNEEKPEVPESPTTENTEKPGVSESKDDNPGNPGDENTARYKDGVYQAEALCDDVDTFTYTVRVNVTVKDGSIADIGVEKVNDQSEYPEDNDSYLNYAINGRTRGGVWYEGVVKQILASQTADHVDVVASATYSSNAVTEAVKKALAQAAVEEAPEESSKQEESSDQESSSEEESSDQESSGEEESRYVDGVYQADALCDDEDTFSYTVRTSITIAEGSITEVAVEKLNDNSEDPESNDIYLDYAINGRTRKDVWYEGVVNQILNNQSADHIDAVSSATYSSNAIAEAAKTALAQADSNSDKSELSVLDYVVMAWNDLFDDLTERSFQA